MVEADFIIAGFLPKSIYDNLVSFLDENGQLISYKLSTDVNRIYRFNNSAVKIYYNRNRFLSSKENKGELDIKIFGGNSVGVHETLRKLVEDSN